MDRIKNILPTVIRGFESPEKQARSKLVTEWAGIAGASLAKHTRPQLTQKGVLYVYVDESVLAFEVSQRYRSSLLKRAQAVLGEETVKEVKVFVGK